MLDDDIQQKMKELEDQSAGNTALTLCIALSYGSRQEILNAAKKVAALAARGDIKPDEVSAELFSSLLYTHDIPDPDILIRTSGEQRISNYLLWQIAYSELFFTDTLWPDFSKEELLDIVKKFSLRERRYGKN
jgi:undecaprenyl diphosphate synthase